MLSKAQIFKIIQSGRFLCKILGPLLKTRLPLLKSVIKPLGLLGLTAASSAIAPGVQKKIYGSGTTTLVISNEKMNNIIIIVQALKQLKMKKNLSLVVTRYFSLHFARNNAIIIRKRTVRAGEGIKRKH